MMVLVSTPWIIGYHQRLFHEGQAALPTLPAEANLRRLSVEEAAVIQSFPRDTPFQGRQSAKFRQIGNAVPPRLAFAVASAVMKTLQGQTPSAGRQELIAEAV